MAQRWATPAQSADVDVPLFRSFPYHQSGKPNSLCPRLRASPPQQVAPAQSAGPSAPPASDSPAACWRRQCARRQSPPPQKSPAPAPASIGGKDGELSCALCWCSGTQQDGVALGIPPCKRLVLRRTRRKPSMPRQRVLALWGRCTGPLPRLRHSMATARQQHRIARPIRTRIFRGKKTLLPLRSSRRRCRPSARKSCRPAAAACPRPPAAPGTGLRRHSPCVGKQVAQCSRHWRPADVTQVLATAPGELAPSSTVPV